MTHKNSLAAVNTSLQDIRNVNDKSMGGILLILAGDFRQTLPIVPKGTAADQIEACLKRSTLWQTVEKMSLTINMRVQQENDPSSSFFANQLLQIGNGTYPLDKDGFLKFGPQIGTVVKSKEELIDCVFPNIDRNFKENDWLTDRAILAPLNINVDDLNELCQSKLPGNNLLDL